MDIDYKWIRLVSNGHERLLINKYAWSKRPSQINQTIIENKWKLKSESCLINEYLMNMNDDVLIAWVHYSLKVFSQVKTCVHSLMGVIEQLECPCSAFCALPVPMQRRFMLWGWETIQSGFQLHQKATSHANNSVPPHRMWFWLSLGEIYDILCSPKNPRQKQDPNNVPWATEVALEYNEKPRKSFRNCKLLPGGSVWTSCKILSPLSYEMLIFRSPIYCDKIQTRLLRNLTTLAKPEKDEWPLQIFT